MDRRQFLRHLGLATGAAASPSLLHEVDAADPARPLHVIIAGAGLAGLCAGLELERRGHRVTLLEADSRHIGGRARTLRFENGLYGEAGAMRIPTGHHLTRHYVKEFGLPLRHFVYPNPEAYYYVRGRRERIRDVGKILSLYQVAAGEQGKSPDDLWNATLIKRLQALTVAERADLGADTYATPAVRALDALSLQRFCEQEGLSPEAIELLAVTYGQEAIMHTALTAYLLEERDGVWNQGFDEIVGGTDLLARGFVQRLKSKPRQGAQVLRLEQDPLRRTAAAVYRQDGKERRIEGDFLLCTLPLPVVAHLEVEPAFSGAKRRAIRQVSYDSSTKVLALTERRFWEQDEGIYGGGTFTDLPTGTTYYPSDNAVAKDARVSASPALFLASYTWGQDARRLAGLSHRERSRVVLTHLSRVHPQLRESELIRRTASWSWDNHPWSRGAFAWYLPGQHTALHRHVVAPEGRIYFAGEHASLNHSWMQGAFESALRAVREMLSAA